MNVDVVFVASAVFVPSTVTSIDSAVDFVVCLIALPSSAVVFCFFSSSLCCFSCICCFSCSLHYVFVSYSFTCVASAVVVVVASNVVLLFPFFVVICYIPYRNVACVLHTYLLLSCTY